MARIIYGALVESIRGSIKGTTFQRNAYGYTVKAKPNMVNPNSATQNERKAQFSRAMQKWQNLTSGERSNWDTYASTFPIPTRLNPDAYLNGFNAFARWHAITELWSPSTTLTDPSGPQGSIGSYTSAILYDGPTLKYTNTADPTEGPWLIYLFLSRPVKSSTRFIKSITRFMFTAAQDPGGVELIIETDYERVFGILPQVGDLLAVREVFQNTTNGQIFFQPAQIIEVT